MPQTTRHHRDPRTLSLGEAYEEYRPYLFKVAALLAKRGHRATPTDAADLAHDFFLEEWDSVTENYRPERARVLPDSRTDPFFPYLHQAFYRFARRRLAGLNKLRLQGVDPSAWSRFPAQPPTSDRLDLDRLGRLVKDLPHSDQEVLTSYLSVGSERLVAERLELSRHEVRKTLPRAVWGVAHRLGRPPHIPVEDWQVTTEVFLHDLTVFQAARRLGIPPRVAASRHERTLHTLVAGLRRTAKDSRPMDTTLLDIVRTVLAADPAALQTVQERAGEIQEFLDTPEAEALRPLFEEASQAQLDAFFGALLAETPAPGEVADGPPEAEAERIDAFLRAADDEATANATVFADSLLPTLSGDLRTFASYFQSLPEVDDDLQASLLLEPDVIAVGDGAEPLVRYGLTPTTLITATEAVSRLIVRAYRHGDISGDDDVTLRIRDEEISVTPPALTEQMFVDEVGLTCECSEPTARLLLRWTVEAAGHHAHLFRRLEAVPCSYPPPGVTLYRGPVYDSFEEQMADPEPALATR